MFFVYILQNEKGRLYIGQTNNLQKRLYRHNAGLCLYTKNHLPWRLIYFENFPSRSLAIKKEKYFKSLKNKKYLEDFIKVGRSD